MAYTPISGTVPQYSNASNELASDHWLKFYVGITTTPMSMATDSYGTTLLAKCKLNTSGQPITSPYDNDSVFIPHISQTYRIVLYKSEVDADNNNTANAEFNVGGIIAAIAPSANAVDIALRNTTVLASDDYEKSPIFVVTEDFTAGAGPHVITVPSGWVPSNVEMRFYIVDASGVVSALAPTTKTTTSFTIQNTLLSTDRIFIGDNNFRNQFEGDPADIRTKLDVYTKGDVYTQADVYTKAETASAPWIPSYTGFSASTVHYVVSGFVTNEKTFSGLAANGVIASMGPTGSGADNIDPGLDIIPLSATYLDVYLTVGYEAAVSSSQGIFITATLYSYSNNQGVSAIIKVINTSTSQKGYARVAARVSLDSQNRFRFRKLDNSNTAPNMIAYYKINGFGV
jgi:hypothetical protein